MKINYAQSQYRGHTLISWNIISAMILLAMALIIFFGYDTPAICYTMTSAFGFLFVANACLGSTRIGSSRLWKGSSYMIGIFMMLFGFSSAVRQIMAGIRPPFIGGWVDLYPLIIATFVIGLVGLVFITACYNGIKTTRAGKS